MIKFLGILQQKNFCYYLINIGHFAPWPGGGACYDYDAIFMLTSKFVDEFGQEPVLRKTLDTIINEQNSDGGFYLNI